MTEASLLRLTSALSLLVLCGCPPVATDPPAAPPPAEFPEVDAWGGRAGPGIPAVTFSEESLWEGCAFLTGDDADMDHHNFVTMYDGWLLMPWAPEWSGGGLTFFDMSDPCDPIKVGELRGERTRESHNMGLAMIEDRTYAVLNDLNGIQFWDISDGTDPQQISRLRLEGVFYPDAYARVILSVFWQGRYVYAAGADNGIYIIDASNPADPVLVDRYVLEPAMRVGAIHAVGNQALVTGAEGRDVVLLDLSDPVSPQPIAGGSFQATDAEGEPRDYYFANWIGRYAWFARKEGGGGFIAFDISDPRAPVYAGSYHTPDGNGGYVFRQGDHVAVGDSNFGSVYDVSDLAAPLEVGRGDLTGDLDTATLLGNLLILAVDDDAEDGQSTSVVPFAAEPDLVPPSIELHRPAQGATGQAVTTRVGLSFDEMVDAKSVFSGSFRVADPDGVPVPGYFTAQEGIANFAPAEALLPGVTYSVEIPAGGIIDMSGNPIAETVRFYFSTAGASNP